MTHATETNRLYYTPVFLDGESYDEMMAHLENDGLAWAVDYARQWDYGNEDEAGPESYRGGLYPHEREYGPHDGYSLIISRSVGYAYLVRDAR